MLHTSYLHTLCAALTAVCVCVCTIEATYTDSGCYDGTTDGLQNSDSPHVAACTGVWQGHIKNSSVLCAAGWRVCSWHHREHLASIQWDTAVNITGCYAYNAAQASGRCKPCVDNRQQDDLAGIGSGCSHRVGDRAGCITASHMGFISASCCEDSLYSRACQYRPGITTGVLCCKQPGAAPTIMVSPRPLTHVMTGVTFILSCQAKGNPTPTITWTRNGQKLDTADHRVAVFDSGYLLISEARVSDSGQYWCIVQNSAGSDKARAKVIVSEHKSGCADGTTDALQQYENIQGCEGEWKGHIKRGRSLCAKGWQVCSPKYSNLLRLLTWQDASQTKGCYAYNAANTLTQCSRCHSQGADMAGIGGGCGRVRQSYRSCLAEGRVDVYKSRLTTGCRYKRGVTTGVMCCKKNERTASRLWPDYPDCQPKCANGGKCIDKNRCQCAKGYKGAWCQNPICPGGCIPYSVCIKPGVCRCRSGHVGPKCKPRKDQCKRPCLNGGRCRGAGVCKCASGYTGTHCHHTVETKRWHNNSDMNRTD